MRATPATTLQWEINVTPLVDVCLVLLIIFMVVTPVLVTGMPVRLPDSSTAEGLAKQPMHITITADRIVFVDSVAIRVDQLDSELRRRSDEHRRPVVVRADKTLAYGEVTQVLDACRAAGFENVGLATTPAADARPAR
jgi:biopolymer transport protein ExbD